MTCSGCPGHASLPDQPRPGVISGCLPEIALRFKTPGGILAVSLGCPQLGLLAMPRGHGGQREGVQCGSFTPRVLPLEGSSPAPLTQGQEPILPGSFVKP